MTASRSDRSACRPRATGTNAIECRVGLDEVGRRNIRDTAANAGRSEQEEYPWHCRECWTRWARGISLTLPRMLDEVGKRNIRDTAANAGRGGQEEYPWHCRECWARWTRGISVTLRDNEWSYTCSPPTWLGLHTDKCTSLRAMTVLSYVTLCDRKL
jgi:hypothetical protein